MTLMFIAVLTIAGSTAVTINSTDLLLGGAFKSSQIAFHNADSGVNYAASQISELIEDNKLKLDGIKTKESYAFKKPSGFEFIIARRHTFKRIANTRKYLLQVTGHARPNSPIKSIIEVVLQRRTALEYGLFAADRLDLPAQGRIYSYDSRLVEPGHNPKTSTSIVEIATNGMVTAQAGHLDLGIDGDILLGATPAGDDAYFTFREASPDVPPPPVKVTTGENNQFNLLPGDELPTDPLNIEKMVTSVQKRLRRKNNNGRVLRNRGNRITTSFYLAKGNYYLKDITLGSSKFLMLDAMRGDVNIYADSMTFEGNAKLFVLTDREAGNVNIYLGGAASFGSASASAQPRFNVTGDASTFRMLSSSSEPINLYHKGDFKGLIYAPYAPVTVRNTSAHGYGLLWSRMLDFSMNTSPYTFYTDTALQEQFLSGNVEILSWKELRD